MTILQNPVFLASIFCVTAFAAGLIPVLKPVRMQPKLLRSMTGIAAGILITSALLIIIPEGFEYAEDYAGIPLIGGFLLMMVIECFGFGHAIHEEHHSHSDEHGHGHVNHPTDTTRAVVGLSMHALTDGIAIGSALLIDDIHVTLSFLIAIIAHKLPAAFSIGVFSMHERGNMRMVIRDLAFFSIATPVTILITYFSIGNVDAHVLGATMLFAAGTFLYVATVDVLPNVHNPETGKSTLFQVIVGTTIMCAVLLLLPSHSHSH